MFLFLFNFAVLFYLELYFKINIVEEYGPAFLSSIFYLLALAALLTLLLKLFRAKWQKRLFLILHFILSLWFCVEVIFTKTFGVYFSLATIGLADQAMGFFNSAVKIVLGSIPAIISLYIPFFAALIYAHYASFKKINIKSTLFLLLIIISGYGLFFYSLPDDGVNSPRYVYLYTQNNALNHTYFGVLPSTLSEFRKTLTGFHEELVIDENTDIASPDFADQVLDIDFASLTSDNEAINDLNAYVQNQRPTEKNEYTGFFEGKNLILIMAESFNEVAVSPTLTPTLYKLVNNGFVFENFYSPVILSTIGGEFQELTGLYPNLNMLSYVWRTGKNAFPMGIANLFKEAGYDTYAYHNHDYDFQERNIYLASLGFDNYQGCGNGLEERIDCSIFPKSDEEMIEATFNDYINSDHFLVYYATVSGHMNYDFTDNAMSIKHEDEVADLPYSYRVKAYLATQIELDKALQKLLELLEESGKLDDTVIALVGDHYPYALSLDEVNEMADEEKDDVIEINRSNFILYNSAMDTVHIEKVGSQIDVLPTIYNLFALPYDSRLFAGRDILDTSTPGLAIFDNRSWVSDLGRYYAVNDSFVPNEENIDIAQSYIDAINETVAGRIAFSLSVMENNYYAYLWNEE